MALYNRTGSNYGMQNREALSAWIEIASNPEQPQQKRHQAFTALVTEFQDMAFGSAYALLGDYTQAEDVAQDAFITAWQNLNQLRDPKAFPGWLRQIVTSQCHRRLRRKQLPTVPLENALSLEAEKINAPEERLIRQTASETLHTALDSLPEIERQVTILFYIADYTQAEIADFTGLSCVGVKKRLASARRRLQERILFVMQEELQIVRPSQSDVFAVRVLAFTKLFSALINEGTSLVCSLHKLAAEETDSSFRTVIEDITHEIESGNCLSKALAKHPSFFSEVYTQAIREGEVKGVLEVVLERLANGTYVPNTIPYFSSHASKAWENGQLLTHIGGHTPMETEHVLLGLLMQGENKAIEFLRDSQAPLWKLRWELQRHLATQPRVSASGGISLTLQQVTQIASAEAEKNDTIIIGTLYLLLGMVETEGTTAFHLLHEMGTSSETIRARIVFERRAYTDNNARLP